MHTSFTTNSYCKQLCFVGEFCYFLGEKFYDFVIFNGYIPLINSLEGYRKSLPISTQFVCPLTGKGQVLALL